MNRFEIRAAASIGLLYLVRMLGLFMVLPVLPLLVDDIAGATPFLIGLAVGAYGASQACLQIPLGALSDRLGRKPVIIGGLVVFVAGSVVAGFAEDIYAIVFGRFLQGCGAIASTLLALVSDVTRIEHRSKSMAIVGISIAGSFGLALILGPVVAQSHGISGVFFFSAIAGVVGIALVVLLIPTPTVRAVDPAANVTPASIRPLLAKGDVRRVAFGIFALHYLLMSSFIVLPVLMAGTGEIADDAHYRVYFWVLLASFVVMLPLMRIADRARITPMLIMGMIALLATASLMLSEVRGLYPVLIAMMFFFMAFNLMEVMMPALMSKVAPVGDRGTAMGLYTTAQFLGGFAGGTAGGFILGMWDTAYLMYANAAICVAWFVFAAGGMKPVNVRTVTVVVSDSGNLSATEVVDALLSVQGVLEVALIEQESLAYLKVDSDTYDKQGLARLRAPALDVISQ